jgi:cobalt-zinc-cadmium efflux system outer membrane protein
MVTLSGVGAIGDDQTIFATAFEPRNYLLAAADPVGIGSVMAMWTLYSGGRDRSAATYSDALVAEAEARLETARQEIARGIRVAFAEAMAASEKQFAATAGYQGAEELLRITEQMFQAGSAPEAFVLRARAGLEAARRIRSLAEAESKSAVAALNLAVGTVRDERVNATTWDRELAAPDTLEEALEQSGRRPEYRAAQARRRAALARARSARQSAYPELNLVGMGTGMATESESNVFYKVGLVLSMPLADGGMRRAEADEMAAIADQAMQENQAVNVRVTSEVIAAWSRWAASPDVVRASEAQVAAAEEAYRIAKLRYQEGKAPQVEVEQVAAGLVDALAARAEANAFRRIAWANLMRAVGISPDQEDQN